MNPLDAGNPYRPPEATIAALREGAGLPPAHAAIARLCGAVGAMGSLLTAGAVARLGVGIASSGWRSTLAGDGPRRMLIASLGLLGTTAFLLAARQLRDRRGRPGLILCGVAIALSYLAFWLTTR